MNTAQLGPPSLTVQHLISVTLWHIVLHEQTTEYCTAGGITGCYAAMWPSAGL